jgi:hypothetical protein
MVERRFRIYPWILSTMFGGGVLLVRAQKRAPKKIDNSPKKNIVRSEK